MADSSKGNDTVETGILIVGSGFGGLCAAIKLKEAGRSDFLILERAGEVGGTWRDNSYPGCCCDVRSALYSFSFEQNPEWSCRYPKQEELFAYLKEIARKYGILPYIQFHHDMEEARFDNGENCWLVRTNQGHFKAPVLISAVGGLSEPALPDIPGIEMFQGKVFHSAQWDHDYSLQAKRAAVIGTGASAIQIVPAIAPEAARVDVYQRTAPWVAPRNDRPIGKLAKALKRTPLKWVYRGIIYLQGEFTAMGITRFPLMMKFLQRLLLLHIRRSVPDPALRKKIIPDYIMGCKRILISDDWYPALQRDNVDLITTSIDTLLPHAIRTTDGTIREIDAVILATGFQATDNPVTKKVIAKDGRRLSEIWSEGEEAYLGTLVHGLPNYFFITGPNTGIGHTSLVYMIESQVNYIVKAIKLMEQQQWPRLEVRREVQDRFNQWLHQRMKDTVWASGCKSWYQNKSGKITTLWPTFTFQFRRRLRKPKITDFEMPQPSEASAADPSLATSDSRL